MLHNDHCEKDYPKIIGIVSFSLHVFHGAFRSGVEATVSSLNNMVKAMWKIFDDSLARLDTYIKTCEVDEYPLTY